MKKGLLWWCTAASVGSSHRQCPEAVSFLVHKRPDKAIRPESRAPVMFNCPFRANFLLSVLHLLVLASCAAGRSLIFFAHCCGRRLTKKADQVPLVSEKRTMTRGLYLGSFCQEPSELGTFHFSRNLYWFLHIFEPTWCNFLPGRKDF